MNEALIVDYTVKAMILVLILSMPPIIVATVIGIGVSLIQALTQVQEQTLPFAIKLIVVTITLLLSVHWVGGELYNYTEHLFNEFPALVR